MESLLRTCGRGTWKRVAVLLLVVGNCVGGLGSTASFSFPTFSSSSALTLEGSADFRGTNLQLTNDTYQYARAWPSGGPIEALRDFGDVCYSASFNVSFSFTDEIVNGTFGGGDGIAFAVLASNAILSDMSHTGDYFGLGESKTPVGVFSVVFDTWYNSYTDKFNKQVGTRNTLTNSNIYSVQATDLSNFTTVKYVWVDYDGFTDTLLVYLATEPVKPSTALLSSTLSLCEWLRPLSCDECSNVTTSYFVLAAGTGFAASYHDIQTWNMTITLPDFAPPPPSPPPSPPPPPPSPPSPPTQATTGTKKSNGLLIGISTGSIVAAISLFALLGYCCFRRYQGKGLPFLGGKRVVKRIPLSDIVAATNNFDTGNILGEGGYGTVYVGVQEDGEKWAVKRAINASTVSFQNFTQEVDIISQMSHTNIVQLLGYCDEGTEQILVYEFMEKGSLKKILHDAKVGESLTFQQRVDIAIDVAVGLCYLHHYAGATVIHRDIKTDNILVDYKFKGKIADFGLLKDNPATVINVADQIQNVGLREFVKLNSAKHNDFSGKTKIAGTPGYIDPAYLKSSQVSTKSDVYSFGVVLFELITGRRAIVRDDTAPEDDPTLDTLVHWIQPHVNHIESIVDPQLGGMYHKVALKKLTRLAVICTKKDPENRPTMEEVAQLLAQIRDTMLDKQAIDLDYNDEMETEDTSSRRFSVIMGSSDSTLDFVVPVSQTIGPR